MKLLARVAHIALNQRCNVLEIMAKELIQGTNACDLRVKALLGWRKVIHDEVNEIAGASLHKECSVLSASYKQHKEETSYSAFVA